MSIAEVEADVLKTQSNNTVLIEGIRAKTAQRIHEFNVMHNRLGTVSNEDLGSAIHITEQEIDRALQQFSGNPCYQNKISVHQFGNLSTPSTMTNSYRKLTKCCLIQITNH